MAEYISKESVLKAFKLTAKNPNKDYQRGMQDTIDCLVPEVIADIPTADVQPVKRGKWEGVDYDTFFKCSECGHMTDWQRYKYCPYCGARMDGD